MLVLIAPSHARPPGQRSKYNQDLSSGDGQQRSHFGTRSDDAIVAEVPQSAFPLVQVSCRQVQPLREHPVRGRPRDTRLPGNRKERSEMETQPCGLDP